MQKFIVEKEILSKLNHKNILKLRRTIQTRDKLYYELDYCSKGDLLSLLQAEIDFDL